MNPKNRSMCSVFGSRWVRGDTRRPIPRPEEQTQNLLPNQKGFPARTAPLREAFHPTCRRDFIYQTLYQKRKALGMRTKLKLYIAATGSYNETRHGMSFWLPGGCKSRDCMAIRWV